VTEAAPNLEDFFACGESPEVAPYADPLEAVDNIQFLLTSDKYRADIAQAGQRRTLKDHTYAQRMLTVSEHLMDALR
jgi:spore maturation protein CgeB